MNKTKTNKGKFFIGISLIILTLFIPAFKYGGELIRNMIDDTDGKTLQINMFGDFIDLADTKPYVEDNRTMVPVRLISENLGFEVKWDSGTREFSVKGVDVRDDQIVLIVGKSGQSEVTVTKNGTSTKKKIDESPKVVVTMHNNRLYVPLRFFSESFGYDVDYDKLTKIVYIIFPGESRPDKPQDVVWNGNVNEFLDALEEKTDMVDTGTSMNQVALNKTELLVTDGDKAPGSKDCDIQIVSSGWIIDGRFYTTGVTKRYEKIMATTKTTVEMFTSDETVYGQIDQAIQKQKTTTINTSDGKKITVNGEASGIIIRLYD